MRWANDDCDQASLGKVSVKGFPRAALLLTDTYIHTHHSHQGHGCKQLSQICNINVPFNHAQSLLIVPVEMSTSMSRIHPLISSTSRIGLCSTPKATSCHKSSLPLCFKRLRCLVKEILCSSYLFRDNSVRTDLSLELHTKKPSVWRTH